MAKSLNKTLKEKNIPTDLGFRANLYEKLGLGSQQDYLGGISSGQTNNQLISHFQSNPGFLDALSASINITEIDNRQKKEEAKKPSNSSQVAQSINSHIYG